MDANVVPLTRATWATPETPRDKVRSVAELAPIVDRLRQAGKSVVHAHGTFDLLHIGHVRHLEAARKLGDVLVVTLTANQFVNKGPGRPVFGEALRAEMLASLQYVDWVAINPEPDAVNAIAAIRPDIYVKGQDYENLEGDVTGRIVAERDAVEAHGGRIHFTHEVMFSSTELINRHFNIFDPVVSRHLNGMRGDGGLAETLALIERIRDYHDVIPCLGARESHEELVRSSLRPNVSLHTLRRPAAPTTLKRRFVDPTSMRKLFELYVMDDSPLPDAIQSELDRLISTLAP